MEVWLDDERDPVDPLIIDKFGSNSDMLWVKSVSEAIEIISQGNVSFLSFDHDLGEKLTGYDLAKWIESKAFNRELPPFQWNVHSQNPVGKQNIISAMENAEKFWNI